MVTALGAVGDKVSTKLYDDIVAELESKMGEKLVEIEMQMGTETHVEKQDKLSLVLNFDCTQLLSAQFTPILTRILSDLDTPSGTSTQ